MNDKRILIVGHGLAGATLAYQLYKQQIQFTVVENPQYNAASRVAAGMINPIVFRRLNKSWMLDECLPIMHHFYKEIEHDLNLSFYHNMDIHKLLSEEEKQFWDQKLSKNEDLHRYLLKSVLSELKSNQVKEYPATGIVKQGGYCDLNILLNGLKNKWIQLNSYVAEKFIYDDLKISGENINWKGEEYTHVVFCEGAGVSQNPYFNWSRLQPVKGELLTIEAKGLEINHILNKNMFVLPVGNHIFKVGATYNWKDLTDEITTEGLDELKVKLSKILNTDYEVLEQKAGVRPTVIDRRPILGKHPKHNHLLIFNGLGTKGVMLAPFFSEYMLQLILNQNTQVPHEVNVQRFL